MTKALTNRLCLKEWASGWQLKLLEEAVEDLKLAWDSDQRRPKSFPIHTFDVLVEVQDRLRNPNPAEYITGKLPPPGPPAESLFDLIDETIVKTVYEQQNAGSYKQAIREASKGGKYGSAAFHKIAKCIQPAYGIGFYGENYIPKPRVDILHRGLVEIAEQLKLETSDDVMEFQEDVCPCKKRHSTSAIVKMQRRIKSQREDQFASRE